MSDRIKKLIDGWHNETDEEKSNDINEFINKLITEKENEILSEYKRKIHGMIMVAEMRIDEIKKTKPKLIKILKFEQNQNKTVNHDICYRIKEINGRYNKGKTELLSGARIELINNKDSQKPEVISKDLNKINSEELKDKEIKSVEDTKSDNCYLRSEDKNLKRDKNISLDTGITSNVGDIHNYCEETNLISENSKKSTDKIARNNNEYKNESVNKYNIKTLKNENTIKTNKISNSPINEKTKTEQGKYNIKMLKSTDKKFKL